MRVNMPKTTAITIAGSTDSYREEEEELSTLLFKKAV